MIDGFLPSLFLKQVIAMKPLQMHSSNFKYVYDPVIDPLSPTCANCEFMPDDTCGWGYEYLDECVFQIEPRTQYSLIPRYDEVLDENGNFYRYGNGKAERYSEKRHRIAVIVDNDLMLEEFLENAEIYSLDPYWSSDEELEYFYSDNWEHRRDINEKFKEREKRRDNGWQYDDYLRWSFQKKPCSLCGKVTKEYLIFGHRARCKTSPIVKICTGCIDSSEKYCDDWISFDERLCGC